MTELTGIVVVDKPPGMTSHDVVARARRSLGVRRVGHGGTLDPDATGVLVIGVGRATRLLSYAQAASKRYSASGRLGVTTTTQDGSGEVTGKKRVRVSQAGLEDALESFRGEIDQVPPMVSAVKVKGERLYKKARRGEEVDRPARRVTITSLELTDFDAPDFSVDVRCSSGTYVRTLIADVGEALGCGAHLTELRRTESGGFTEADAVALDAVSTESVLPPMAAVGHLPAAEVSESDAAFVRTGRPISARPELDVADGGDVAILFDDALLAVYRRSGDVLLPERVLESK